MSGKSILVVGIIGVILLIIVGAALSMRSNPSPSNLASVSNTAWYGTNGQVISGQPQFVTVVPGQYVVGQQALPQPRTQIEYVTVPAPVIVGSFDNGSDSADAGSASAAPRRTRVSSNAPYPTYAEYEAAYYAKNGYAEYPATSGYSYPAYSGATYPPVTGYAYPRMPQYPPSYGAPSSYLTYEEYSYTHYRQY
jgi:hypothetical protein